MAELIFKTRGNFTPRGLPKVYLCCHPDDFSYFAEEICERLLKNSNCAICYYDGTPGEDWELELSQVQLFVMPVTTRLLKTKNRALDVEFPFATAHNIPVLPLMQEQGLEQLFNKICGDLQFLDAHASDVAAFVFDEKLKTYLNSVLVGDELAQQIRAAFRGYIFLSYRKKDRRYARYLMRLIHKNEFCEDIAIWYDEFLVPGEDFNENIQKYLSGSDLFLLNVTPNLVCEENYVAAYEYPSAVQQGKPILAVETVPTDGALLRQVYSNIPAPVPMEDEDLLTAALGDHFREGFSKEDPLRQYYLGLAYLSGVDVEVDYEKAAQLITAAAETGLPDAITKLVQMYQSGHGIERDYDRAIVWQEKKIRLLGSRYADNANEENLEALWNALKECGSAYAIVGDRKQTMEMYKAALELLSNHNGSSGNINSMLAVSYSLLGILYKDRGELQQAKEYCEKAGEYHHLTGEQDRPTMTAIGNMLLLQVQLAEIYSSIGDVEEEKLLEINESCENLASETGNPWFHQTWAYSCDTLARYYLKRGDLIRSEQYFGQTMDLFNNLAEAEKSAMNLHNLLGAAINLADVYFLDNDFAEAIKLYDGCIDLAEAILERTKAMQAYVDLATCYIQLGKCYRKQKKDPQAKVSYKKAQETLDPIVKGDMPAAVLEMYAESLKMQAELASDWEEAMARAMGAAVFLEKCVSMDDSRAAIMRVAAGYQFVAIIAVRYKNYGWAGECFIAGMEWLKKIPQEDRDADLRNKWIDFRKGIANVLRETGKMEKAEELLRENLRICLAAAEDGCSRDSQEILLNCYDELARCLILQYRFEEAQEQIEASMKIVDRFSPGDPVFTHRRPLLSNYMIMGLQYFQRGNLEAAKEYLELFIRETTDLLKDSDDLLLHEDLKTAYDRIADLYRLEGDRFYEAHYLKLLLEEGKVLEAQLNDDDRRRLVEAALKLCDHNEGRFPEKVAEYVCVASHYHKQIKQENRNADDVFAYVQIVRHMGEFFLKEGEPANAKELYWVVWRSKELMEALMAQPKTNLNLLRVVIQCNGRLGQILQQEKQWAQAAECWKDTVMLCRRYLEAEPLELVERYLAQAVSALGLIADEQGSTEEATAYLNEAYALWEKTRRGEPEAQESYADVCMHLSKRKPEEGKMLLIEAFSIYYSLSAVYPEMVHCKEKMKIAEKALNLGETT